MPRTARSVDLALEVPDGPAPLRHRIADAVVGELRAGRLRPGDALPSTRGLAASLGLSRGPVVAAYDELAAAGFVLSRAGSGAVVARGADRAAVAGAVTHVHTPTRRDAGLEPGAGTPARWDLRPGRPDTSLVEPAAWRRAWRAAGSVVPGNDAGAGPPHARLRRVLAEHLRRSRGVAVAPDDLLLVPGVGASLRALPPALGLVGATVALEDPGYAEAWTAFATEGVRVAAVPVDDDGLDPALLPRGTAATYVTPSHQYPLGARMPVTRRVQLLEWARRTGGLVLEDDYDGEFRYDVSPLPALRSLPGADDHVVYIGTASKLVAPSLRVAWLAPPPRLRDRCGSSSSRGAWSSTSRPGWPWPSSSRRVPWPPTTRGSRAPTRPGGAPSSRRSPGTCPTPASRGSTPACTSCSACPTRSTTSTSSLGWASWAWRPARCRPTPSRPPCAGSCSATPGCRRPRRMLRSVASRRAWAPTGDGVARHGAAARGRARRPRYVGTAPHGPLAWGAPSVRRGGRGGRAHLHTRGEHP